jgi:hypothetical protein
MARNKWSFNSLSLSYVIVDYNAGTPIVSIVASNTTDYRMSFVLGYVMKEVFLYK